MALYALAGVLLVCAGCIPAPGAESAFYVLVPYAAALACVVFGAMLHLRTAKNEPARRREDASTRADRLKGWLFVGSACCVLAAVGELVHLLRMGTNASFGYGAAAAGWASVAWMLCYVVLLLAAGACLHLLRKRVG